MSRDWTCRRPCVSFACCRQPVSTGSKPKEPVERADGMSVGLDDDVTIRIATHPARSPSLGNSATTTTLPRRLIRAPWRARSALGTCISAARTDRASTLPVHPCTGRVSHQEGAVAGAARKGLCQRRVVDHAVRVEKVLLRCRAFLELGPFPPSDECDQLHPLLVMPVA